MNRIPEMKLWCFEYAFGGGVYTIEISAETREEAEGRLNAVGANATCLGEIVPGSQPADQAAV